MMVYSMTGFGRGHGQQGPYALRAELRSVNHRYLEIRINVPSSLACHEPELQRRLRAGVARGRIELTLRTEAGSQPLTTLRADLEMAQQLHSSLLQVASALGIDGSIDLVGLAGLRDVLVNDEAVIDTGALQQAMMGAVDQALDDLLASRQREGAGLVKDLHSRVDLLRALTTQVEARLPEWQKQLQQRMQERLRAAILDLSGAHELDEGRVLSEIALLVDRADITEELVRLRAHLAAMASLLDVVGKPMGRKADFLCQEILREVNTMGSKASDVDLTRLVIELKAELERVREQVQNLE